MLKARVALPKGGNKLSDSHPTSLREKQRPVHSNREEKELPPYEAGISSLLPKPIFGSRIEPSILVAGDRSTLPTGIGIRSQHYIWIWTGNYR
ncbi:hypothetical protein CHS0354_003427 [Potamilus streckersoni]|uniref:Uncharacterized protein n=1 Tax=Potamilus streckersoni TaxID=2493646 RepID=A0AAE0SNP5_9BIVA|nr:hypothetical protein CHS0354_003427 [Potamilus streckersoni]